jgi:hypothetical protein
VVGDDDTPDMSGVGYKTSGFGSSVAFGYKKDPAWTYYGGLKLNDFTFQYTDSVVKNTNTDIHGIYPAGFAGVTYQYLIGGQPFETDAMVTLAEFPKSASSSSGAIYPFGTVSFSWRH